MGAVALWVGSALLLSEVRWFSRRPLADRIRPYTSGGTRQTAKAGLLSVQSFRDVVVPLSRGVGERVARVFGVSEDLALRLERVHAAIDVSGFRVRQVGWSVAAFGVGALAALAFDPPTIVALLFVVGGPLLAFLVLEQQVAVESARWQRRIFLELPVVSEQLGMLLSAGYSLGAALNRIAARGRGACGRDLARVGGRIRQGLSEVDALREWAAVADVDALHRLVAVLALNREAGDLGRLIADEARTIRREVQRELVETIERRGQQVWIPVTVAALVPGVVFLSVPFVQALRLFAGT